MLCPAEAKDITCARCQLCAKPDRKAIVGFRAHGAMTKRIDKRLTLAVIQPSLKGIE